MAANKGYDLLIESLPTLFGLVQEARLVTAVGSDDSEQDAAGSEELSIEGLRFARRSFGWTGITKRILAVFELAQSAKRSL